MFAQDPNPADIAIQSAYMQIVEKHHKHDKKKEHAPSEKDIERVEKELAAAADAIKEELKESAFDVDKMTGKVSVSKAVMDRIQAKCNEFHDFVTPEYIEQMRQKVMDQKFSVSDDKFKYIHDENGHLKEDLKSKVNAKIDELNAHYDNIYASIKKGDLEGARKHLALLKGANVKLADDAHKSIHDQNGPLREALIEALTDTDFEARAKVAAATKDVELLAALAQTHMAEDAPGAAEICNHIARNPATPTHILERLAKHPNPKVVESASNNLTSRDSQVNESKQPTIGEVYHPLAQAAMSDDPTGHEKLKEVGLMIHRAHPDKAKTHEEGIEAAKRNLDYFAQYHDSNTASKVKKFYGLGSGFRSLSGQKMHFESLEESGTAFELTEMAGYKLDASATGRVAAAFAAGRAANVKSAYTDGKSYFLHGHEIAKKLEDGNIEMNWAGWYTPTTERHLNTILHQVAPGKSVYKKQHRDQGVEKFLVKDL